MVNSPLFHKLVELSTGELGFLVSLQTEEYTKILEVMAVHAYCFGDWCHLDMAQQQASLRADLQSRKRMFPRH